MPANITAEQMRAARALLHWDQRRLSEASGVSVPTIKRLEGGTGPLAGNVTTTSGIIGALEGAGVVFIPENGGGAGVRLAKPAGT